MRSIILATVVGIGLPAQALATPIGFATYLLTGNGSQSQSTQASAQASAATGTTYTDARADIASGSLKIYTSGSNSSAGVQALFYDTLTFAGSSFGGAFGTSYDLTLTASFDGTFSGSNIFDAGTGGRIHVYSGSTVIDSSVFNDPNSLIDFMFINGPTPLCSTGVNGPDLTTQQGSFSFTTSCTVTVTAANPTVKILFNLPGFVNAPAGSWTLDMLNTATLDLGNLGGRTVYSASGVLPGTQAAPIPEPASILLMGLGLAAGVRRRFTSAR